LVIPAKVVNKTQIERKHDYIINFQSKPSSGSWDESDSYTETELFSKALNLKQNGESLTIVFELPAGEHRLYSITENSLIYFKSTLITCDISCRKKLHDL
jgi:hypothetical protein